jgi:Zn-finger protein
MRANMTVFPICAKKRKKCLAIHDPQSVLIILKHLFDEKENREEKMEEKKSETELEETLGQ